MSKVLETESVKNFCYWFDMMTNLVNKGLPPDSKRPYLPHEGPFQARELVISLDKILGMSWKLNLDEQDHKKLIESIDQVRTTYVKIEAEKILLETKIKLFESIEKVKANDQATPKI